MGNLIGYNPIPSISIGDIEKILELDDKKGLLSNKNTAEVEIKDIVKDFMLNINTIKPQNITCENSNIQNGANKVAEKTLEDERVKEGLLEKQKDLERQLEIAQIELARKEEIEKELIKQRKLEQQRAEQDRQERERIEHERVAQQQIIEQQRIENERIEHQRELDNKRFEQQQAEQRRTQQIDEQHRIKQQNNERQILEQRHDENKRILEQKRIEQEKFEKLEQLKKLKEQQNIRVDSNNIEDYYNKLDIDALYKEVRSYAEQSGLANQVVDRIILDKKFGKLNISKLVIKSYLISIGKGVTFGNV